MINLLAWAARHNISPQAMQDLQYTMGLSVPPSILPADEGSEAGVQSQITLEAARRGMRLWRNNSGAAVDKRGVPVRFGLGNISPQVNKIMKSSDLIGSTPTRCPCGRLYGVFTALEVKKPGWKFRQSDQRAVAQLNFINIVIASGGIAKFIQRVEDL